MVTQYRLFKRKDKKVWYFYYYEDGKRIYHSTGKIKKFDAESYVEEFLGLNKQAPGITLNEYTKDFFTWETCTCIKRQHSKGRRVSRAYRERLIQYNPITNIEHL